MTEPTDEPTYCFQFLYRNNSDTDVNLKVPTGTSARLEAYLTPTHAQELVAVNALALSDEPKVLQLNMVVLYGDGPTVLRGAYLEDGILPLMAATYSAETGERWEPRPIRDIPFEVCDRLLNYMNEQYPDMYDGYEWQWPADVRGSGVPVEQILQRKETLAYQRHHFTPGDVYVGSNAYSLTAQDWLEAVYQWTEKTHQQPGNDYTAHILIENTEEDIRIEVETLEGTLILTAYRPNAPAGEAPVGSATVYLP